MSFGRIRSIIIGIVVIVMTLGCFTACMEKKSNRSSGNNDNDDDTVVETSLTDATTSSSVQHTEKVEPEATLTPTPTPEPTATPIPTMTPTPTPKPSNKNCKLMLDIDFDSNIILAKYSVTMYLDDKKITNIEHGKYYIDTVTVKSGEHTLSFTKRGDDSIVGLTKFTIDTDSTLKCIIKAHESYIEVGNVTVLDHLESTKIKMPDVTELRLDKAVDELFDMGFVNIKTKSQSTIIMRSHWIVTAQNIKPGKTVDRTTEIVLTCVKDG